MFNYIKIILLMIAIAFVYWRVEVMEEKMVDLDKRVQWLNTKEAKDPNRIKIISQQLKNKITSVLSFRCNDSSTPVVKWNSTATKIDSRFALTAHHTVSEYDIKAKKKRVLPFKCLLYSDGNEVAGFELPKNKFYQIKDRDIVIIEVKGNEDWKKVLVSSYL